MVGAGILFWTVYLILKVWEMLMAPVRLFLVGYYSFTVSNKENSRANAGLG